MERQDPRPAIPHEARCSAAKKFRRAASAAAIGPNVSLSAVLATHVRTTVSGCHRGGSETSSPDSNTARGIGSTAVASTTSASTLAR